jgi:DNA polymerase III delta prime subunit
VNCLPLLTEKYRPQKLEDMVGFVPTFSIDEDVPHLLLYGSAGTGKTTLAKIIIRKLNADSITLNASSERGIDVVRQKVSDFASTQSSNNNIKIIFLDESDHLTNDAQAILRNIMETYARNCRFILTANYINKIIEPIQSRCVLVKFDNIPKIDIVERMKFICENEGIPYEIEALSKIVDRTGSDLRSAINKLEEMKNGVFVSKLADETKLAMEVFTVLRKKDFITARQLYLDAHVDPEQFLKDLYDVTYSSKESLDFKKQAILDIAESYKFLSQVAWKEILIEAILIKLMR